MMRELFAPDSGTPSGGSSGPVDEGAQDLADIGEDVDTEESDEEESDEDETETSEEAAEAEAPEDDEEESQDEEEDDEEEDRESKRLPEESERDAPPSVRAIKEKYPNFFKEFPGLRAAFFEHPKYQEIFPDVDSAAAAAQKAEEFDALENSLVDRGDPATLFKVLAENSPKALRKIIDNLPEAVRSIDEAAYTRLATPIIEELLFYANSHGNKTGNKNLQLSARHLANFVFANGGDIPDISARNGKKAEGPSEAEVQLARERQAYQHEKFNGAMEEIGGSISSEMNRFLDHKLDGLSKFEKTQIIKEARIEIDRVLTNDKGFQNLLSGLWKRARESGYSAESKSRLKRAWLDRARLIAPKIRARYKQEALGGRSAGSSSSAPNKIQMKRQFPQKSGGTPSHGSRTVLDPHKIDWRKTSDLDILNSK